MEAVSAVRLGNNGLCDNDHVTIGYQLADADELLASGAVSAALDARATFNDRLPLTQRVRRGHARPGFAAQPFVHDMKGNALGVARWPKANEIEVGQIEAACQRMSSDEQESLQHARIARAKPSLLARVRPVKKTPLGIWCLLQRFEQRHLVP